MKVLWMSRDRHWSLTALALVGFLIAVAMALYGLPPIDLHGPLHRMGVMDPACGGTRSARLFVMGQWGAAWRYNPLGILAVLGAALMLIRATIGLGFHRWLDVEVRPRRATKVAVLFLLVVALALLEIRQQSRVDLLLVPAGQI